MVLVSGIASSSFIFYFFLEKNSRGLLGVLTIPRAMVFALVLGWFFMKRRGTERPIARWTRTSWTMWIASFWRWEGVNGIFVMGNYVVV